MPKVLVRRLAGLTRSYRSAGSLIGHGNYLSYSNFDYNRDRTFVKPNCGSLTYGDFRSRFEAMSAYLASSHSVRRRSVVAVQVNKSVDNLCLFAAVLNLGAIYVPLNTAYTKAELDYLLSDCKPDVFVFEEKIMKQLPKRVGTAVSSEHLYSSAGNSSGYSMAALDEHEPAVICYTSGTTGKPKGAVITHRNITTNGRALAHAWQFTGDDVLLHILPFYHVHGLLVAVSPVLFSGSSLILHEKFDVSAICADLPNATVMMGVPTHCTRLLDDHKFNAATCKNIRLFTCGSAPLSPRTFEAVAERTGHIPLERYGMTEGQMICTNPYDGKRKPGTVGKAMPGYEVRIRDGILECRGPGVFSGYLNQPEKTAASFTQDGFFITGDNAVLDEDCYVKITGRASDMIISGGLNIYPKEIETVLESVEHVIESAVLGRPHPDYGETPIAVVRHDGSASVEQLKDASKSSLAGFKRPTDYILTTEPLPRNPMGKIQKNILRKIYSH